MEVRAWKRTAEVWLDLALLGGVLTIVLLDYLLVSGLADPGYVPDPSFVKGFIAVFASSISLSTVGGTGGVLARLIYSRAAGGAGWSPAPQPIRLVGGYAAAAIGVFTIALLLALS